MRKTRIAIALTLLLVLTCCSYQKADEKDINSAFNSVSTSFVRVESGSLYGSGNIWEIETDNITIVSAYHIIDDSADIIITFGDRTSTAAEILYTDESKDIVFLSTTVSDPSKYSQIKFTEETPKDGENIFVIDPDTLTATAGIVGASDIYIEDFDQNMIYCLLSVTPGMSGSGCFDYYGNYIGLLLGGSDNAEAVCISVNEIKFPQ